MTDLQAEITARRIGKLEAARRRNTADEFAIMLNFVLRDREDLKQQLREADHMLKAGKKEIAKLRRRVDFLEWTLREMES